MVRHQLADLLQDILTAESEPIWYIKTSQVRTKDEAINALLRGADEQGIPWIDNQAVLDGAMGGVQPYDRTWSDMLYRVLRRRLRVVWMRPDPANKGNWKVCERRTRSATAWWQIDLTERGNNG